MSGGIGPVGGVDRIHTPNIKALETKETAEANEPKDKVKISKTREIIEKVIGSPVALLSTATNTVGGFLSGGIAGADESPSSGKGAQAVGVGLSGVLLGGLAFKSGLAMAGWPLAIGMGAAGMLICLTSAKSDSTKEIGYKVGETADKYVSDNKKSDSKLKNAAMNFTEGAITGAGVGAVEGFKQGLSEGAGVVSGVIEGAKGVVSTVAGKYETVPTEKIADTPADAPKESIGKRFLKALIGTPRALLGAIVGTGTGLVGMGLETVNGLIQGVAVGASDSKNSKVSASGHAFMVRAGTVLAGGLAGLAMGGPIGGAIGAGAGLITGQVVRRLEKNSGIDKTIAANMTNAIRHAQKDNTYVNEGQEKYEGYFDRNNYETLRDTIEGSMTGAAAGAKEGFKAGYQGGKGVVDGVFDAGKGIIAGITGIGKGE